MNNKERFINLCLSTSRPGIEKLLDWLETTDFYECPASTRFHGSYEGGLLQHSLNVYDEAKRLLSVYNELQVHKDSVIIAALLHDICKVNYYKSEKRNRKNERGQWESYDTYSVSEKFCFGGHGSKSMYIAQRFIDLTPEEAVAINCHMSSWDGNDHVGSAYEQFPFAWLIHAADEASTYIVESDKTSNA